MDKLTFDNLYKFLVSLGAVLMAPPLLAATFLMSCNVQLVTQSEYRELHDYSKHLLFLKDKIVTSTTSNCIWICSAVEVIGILFFMIGLVKWIGLQSEKDKQDIVKTILLENKITPQTPSDIHKKDHELLLEMRKENISDSEAQRRRLQAYWNYQNSFFEKAIYNDISPNDYDLKINVKIDSKLIDCIALARDNRKRDILFEFKHPLGAINREQIKQLATHLNKLMRIYTENTFRRCEGMIIIATSPKQIENTYIWEQYYQKDIFKDISVKLVSKESLDD